MSLATLMGNSLGLFVPDPHYINMAGDIQIHINLLL